MRPVRAPEDTDGEILSVMTEFRDVRSPAEGLNEIPDDCLVLRGDGLGLTLHGHGPR